VQLVSSAALGSQQGSRFWGHRGSPIEIANTSPRQCVSHRERAPEREEGAWGEDVAPLALFPQLLEREVHLQPQLRTSRRVSVREDAATVPSEEPIVCHTFFWLQHFASLVPVDCAKRGAWIASRRLGLFSCYTRGTSFEAVFRGWLNAEMHRLLTHSSNPDVWLEECAVFYSHLRNRGYPAGPNVAG
jgi:hypothetical protein